jgi:F0F1-type ATP synthase assembly protein I
MKSYGVVMIAVTELVVTVVVCVFGGGWLDKKFALNNVGLAIGAIAGFLVGVVRLYSRLKVVMDSSESS